MHKIFYYLGLDKLGVVEFLFAITPIIGGYYFGNIPGLLVMSGVIFATIFFKYHTLRFKGYKPLTLFFIYWLVHSILISFVDDVNYYGIVERVIMFLLFLSLLPVMDLLKLRGALNLVALISIGGLLFQWIIIANGGQVHPIEIPGLTMSEYRLEGMSIRPSSFYMEPAAYATSMLLPLLIAVLEKKYYWATILILSTFLTTSTTGVVTVFLLLFCYVFTTKGRLKNRIGFVVLGAALIYSYVSFDVFSAGVEKIENTNLETNVRLAQGTYVVSTMDKSDYILGVPYYSAYNYCVKSHRAPKVLYYGESVYMSVFWNLILTLGVVGLLFYLNVYYKLFRKSKLIWPLLVCLVARIFSDPNELSVGYYSAMLIMLIVVEQHNKLITNENRTY